jgi:hypothetical protein
MVKSKLNSDVLYPESKSIEDEDIDYSSPLYDYKIFDKDIVIALGRQRHTFSRYNIVYFPIYLIINETPIAKIGVFEVENSKLIDILDDDGDVKLSKKNIIIYADKEYINNLLKKHKEDNKEKVDEFEALEKGKQIDKPVLLEDVEILDDDDDVLSLSIPEDKKTKSDKDTDETLKDGIFIINDKIRPPVLLQEETKHDAQEIKQDYKEAPKNIWIQKLMKNTNYDIIDNEGGGDCFFAVIRDAFKQIGKGTTVDKLRALLAKEATEKMFQESRSIYTGVLAEYQEKEKEIKSATKTISLLKKRIEKSASKKDSEELVQQAKSVLTDQKRLKVEKTGAKELLEEFEYMENLTTLEKFREFMLTRHYWADTWAISTLEKLLNVKIILLSEQAYESGDSDSVMQCGQLNDTDLESAGSFVPDYYIVTCYTGNHYKLISYKDKHILKFREIPYDVKIMIINKCLEKNSGPYYLIQDFKNMKTRLGLNPNEGEPEEKEDEYLTRDLYDKDTVFSFHSKAVGTPKPGKGSGESINKANMIKYKVLTSIKDWRRKLDDSWITPFTLDGHRWNSVEHYFLASQFKKGFPDFYLKFSVESGTDISKDIETARIAGSKSGKSKDRIVRDSKITIDPNFYTLGTNPIFEVERKKALEAKFSGNLELKNTLLETQNAKLVHFQRSKGHIADTLLMKVRKELIQN